MKSVVIIGVIALANMAATIHVSRPSLQTEQAQRFDNTVREDFFAGFRGDKQRLARGMDLCEKALAADPKHSEAMVWHGSGLMFWAGEAFSRGETPKGVDLWDRGKREMDAAVALAPDAVNVLIPRGATLLEVSRHVPGEERSALLAKGLADYERVLELQQPYFATLSAHARGELLFGLAEGWSRAGDPLKARRYFEQILRDATGSGQQSRAQTWLKNGQLSSTACIGCH